MRFKNRSKKFIWAIVTIEAAAAFAVIFTGFRTYENKVNSNKGGNYSIPVKDHEKNEDVQRITNIEFTEIEENKEDIIEKQEAAETNTATDQSIIQSDPVQRNLQNTEKVKSKPQTKTTNSAAPVKIQSQAPSAQKIETAPAPVTTSAPAKSVTQEPAAIPVTPSVPTEPVIPLEPSVPATSEPEMLSEPEPEISPAPAESQTPSIPAEPEPIPESGIIPFEQSLLYWQTQP